MLYIKNTLSNITLIEVLFVMIAIGLAFIAPKVVIYTVIGYGIIRLGAYLAGKFSGVKNVSS